MKEFFHGEREFAGTPLRHSGRCFLFPRARAGAWLSYIMRNAAAQALLCGNRGRSGGFCRMRRSGSCDKSARPVRGKPSAPRQAAPVSGTSSIGKICPFFDENPKKNAADPRRAPPPPHRAPSAAEQGSRIALASSPFRQNVLRCTAAHDIKQSGTHPCSGVKTTSCVSKERVPAYHFSYDAVLERSPDV